MHWRCRCRASVSKLRHGQATATMLWHGAGGVALLSRSLATDALRAVFQRFDWAASENGPSGASGTYLLTGVLPLPGAPWPGNGPSAPSWLLSGCMRPTKLCWGRCRLNEPAMTSTRRARNCPSASLGWSSGSGLLSGSASGLGQESLSLAPVQALQRRTLVDGPVQLRAAVATFVPSPGWWVGDGLGGCCSNLGRRSTTFSDGRADRGNTKLEIISGGDSTAAGHWGIAYYTSM